MDILSAEDLAAIRIAIEICNNSELKKKILCASEIDYDRYKKTCYRSESYECHRKEQWSKIVENKANILLENLGLTKQLREKVTGLVLLIGMKMLTWAVYHAGILGLSYQFGINFLNRSFFTPQGIIDNKKAAEELLKNKSLSIKQKYTLACLYCLTEHIPDLYRQMIKKVEKQLYNDQGLQRINQPEIVKFWSYYLMGKIDKLRGEKSLDRYRLEKAVESGSKAAVEYCLEKTRLSRKKNALVDAALETVKTWITKGSIAYRLRGNYVENDWVVFRNPKYCYGKWIPSDYFIDILCFLLSKMKVDEKIEFLRNDITAANYKSDTFYETDKFKNSEPSRALECILDWPCQNYFMKTAELMWKFLPERSYADLLLKICDKMNPSRGDLKYGEEKIYDYRKLLKEFWCQSPDHYKRYVFSHKVITHRDGDKKLLEEGTELLDKLLTLTNFTDEDRKNIELILTSATIEEKERIISYEKGKDICIKLMKKEKWQILEKFVSNCLPTIEKAEEFKRRLSFTEEAQSVCIDFIGGDNWNAAEFFIKWSSLAEEERAKLKREVIYSWDGMNVCMYLFSYKGAVIANKFCEWCFSSSEEVIKFKKELIVSKGKSGCADLIIKDKLEVVDEFISWSLLSSEEIGEFKKCFGYETGNYICTVLISGDFKEFICDETGYICDYTTTFTGGKWIQVEKFLTWCFSSEEEISAFKRNTVLKLSAVPIHFSLIEANKWEEAKTFFAWLGLSPEEIKELKKETLFCLDIANDKFYQLLHGDRFHYFGFSDYGSRQEAIEILLRWYLEDKETVLQFRDYFKERNDWMSAEGNKNFDLAIEQHLRDLDEEQRGFESNMNFVL